MKHSMLFTPRYPPWSRVYSQSIFAHPLVYSAPVEIPTLRHATNPASLFQNAPDHRAQQKYGLMGLSGIECRAEALPFREIACASHHQQHPTHIMWSHSVPSPSIRTDMIQVLRQKKPWLFSDRVIDGRNVMILTQNVPYISGQNDNVEETWWDERPNVGVSTTIYDSSRNGASSRKGHVVNGRWLIWRTHA